MNAKTKPEHGKTILVFFFWYAFCKLEKSCKKNKTKKACSPALPELFLSLNNSNPSVQPKDKEEKFSWKMFVGSKFDIPKVTMVAC